MRIILLPVVCVMAFVACNKKVVSPTTTKEGEFAADASTGGTIDYHGLQLRANDLYVMNDPVPNYNDVLNGTETQIASNDTPTTDPTITDPAAEPSFALAGGETQYMKDCAAAGVPIPGAWNEDGSTGWKNRGELDQTKLFAGSGQTVLYTFDGTDGICAALPRYKGGKIQLFGVICTNFTSGKTCFWDNATPTGERVPVPAGYDMSDALGGNQLRENCTGCHRGDNPWIVIPGQPTAMLSKLTNRYTPMGAAAWVNPKATKPVEGCSVEGCHTMPQLSKQFCSLGNGLIQAGVMPDGGGTDGVVEFRTECSNLGF